MAAPAGSGSLPGPSPAGRRVPEPEPALVGRWQAGGGELVELCTQARGRLGGVAAFRRGPRPAVLSAVPAVVAGPLPSLPADGAGLARIDAVAGLAVAAARDGAAGPDGPGLLHVLLDAAGTRPECTDRLIRDELVTLLVAGHETTASPKRG
ncbi:hypothetical protein [Streptomyces subrutilus]|uniref:Uncharacterized protein n=1 Tax=Streptomyces subrutilus TaxID=36818 RepID=A0A1E5PYF2_9ACTN|nr:hypothetical protein [Streptomyces subrutilus]OEJ34567.1 hypothetical protein BGK67_27410 [Streptomyces subrutilus]